MILLGILLLLVVAAVVGFMVMAGANAPTLIQIPSLNISWTPSALVVFTIGAATLLVLVFAISLIRSGTRRRVAKSQELRRLRRMDAQPRPTTTTVDGGHPLDGPR